MSLDTQRSKEISAMVVWGGGGDWKEEEEEGEVEED